MEMIMIEIDLDEARRPVTLEQIRFERDQDGQIEEVVFEFRLGAGDESVVFPISMTELEEDYSLDKLYHNACQTLHATLCSLAETMRRMNDLPKISFKD
jgi:hypothetical protein